MRLFRACVLSLAALVAGAIGTTHAHAQTPGELRPLPKPSPVLLGLRPRFEVRTHITIDRRPGDLLGQAHQSRVGKILSDTKLLTNLADALSQSIKLTKTVAIVSTPCGTSNAFYDPATGNITLCDELFEELEGLFSHMGEGPAFDEAVLGATVFFVLHEVGHALVHQFGVPLLAREEDAVDGIATYLVLTSGVPNVAFSGANAFSYMGARRASGQPLAFWDEHSIHEQRFFNISCWVYGSNPGAYGFLVQTNMLPQRRALRCPGEFRQLSEGVVKLLGPRLASNVRGAGGG